MSILVRQGDFPGIAQRLCSYYIIFDLFIADGQTECPFMPFLLAAVDARDPKLAKVNLVESNFLKLLIRDGTKDLKHKTVISLLKLDYNFLEPDISGVKALWNAKLQDLPQTVKAGVPNVLNASAKPQLASDTPVKEMINELTSDDSSPLSNVFAPQFLNIAPPLLPCDDELVWLDLTNPAWHKPVKDTTGSLSDGSGKAKQLIAHAYTQALSLSDQDILLKELKENEDAVNHIGLTPLKLPDLVEYNPMIAVEVLLKLMNTPNVQITDYFSALVKMEVSLHSMEVVNRLTTAVDLPTEFIYLFISNCITTCELTQDKYVQNRLVRLVCVFLQSLIRNKIINVKDLLIEVEAFCVEFSRIREAAALYRLLKNSFTNEGAAGGTVAGTSNSQSNSNSNTGGAAGTTSNKQN